MASVGFHRWADMKRRHAERRAAAAQPRRFYPATFLPGVTAEYSARVEVERRAALGRIEEELAEELAESLGLVEKRSSVSSSTVRRSFTAETGIVFRGSKTVKPTVKWSSVVDKADVKGTQRILLLECLPNVKATTIKGTHIKLQHADDLLRVTNTSYLGTKNPLVQAKLADISAGKTLAPIVVLTRDKGSDIIGNGTHTLSAVISLQGLKANIPTVIVKA